MTSPALAYTSKGGVRKYRNTDRPGVVYDSVTWASNAGIPKHGINAAKLKLAIEYAMDKHDEWAKIDTREGRIAQIRNTSERAWRPAMERGTSVHEAIERVIDGERYDGAWDQGLAVYLDAFRSFAHDFQPEFGRRELTVFSDEWKYAGTLDAWMTSRTMPQLGVCLLDWKTGKGVYPDYALQLAAYAHAEYGFTADGESIKLPTFEKGLIVHLSPDGYSVHPCDIGHRTLSYFLAALTIARYTSGGDKGLLGETISPNVAGHEWDTPSLIRQITALDVEARLKLSKLFVDGGIPTIPSKWSQVDVERIVALVRSVEPEMTW